MGQVWDSPTMRWVLWGLVVIVSAVLVALLAPYVQALLRDARAGLVELRKRITAWARTTVGDRWTRFWDARGREPEEPVVAGLARIDAIGRSLGQSQIRRLEQLEGRLAEHLGMLKAASAPNPVPTESDRTRITRAIAGGGIGMIAFMTIFAIGLGGVNAILLSAYFRELLGARSPVPTLFPDLQIGHVMAAVFLLFEIGAGLLLHYLSHLAPHDSASSEMYRKRDGAEQVFFWTCWGAVLVLALIEAIAYGVLSNRMNVPARLNITADSVFFGIARYFLAGFGVVLTGLLTASGYAIKSLIETRKRATAERRLLKALERRDATVARTVERVRESVIAIHQAIAGMPLNVAERFRETLGLTTPYPGAPAAYHAATVGVIASTDPSSATDLVAPGIHMPNRPPVRTPTQVLGELGLYLVVGVVLVVASALTTLEVVSFILAQRVPLALPLAWAAGIFLPVGVLAAGAMLRSAFRQMRHATPVEQLLDAPEGRRAYGWLAATTAVIAGLVLAGIAAATGQFGRWAWVNAVLGLAQAGILLLLGGALDAIVVAMVHGAYLGWLGGVRVAAALGVALSLALDALCAVASFLVRLLAVPGDMLLGLFAKRAPAPPLSTQTAVAGAPGVTVPVHATVRTPLSTTGIVEPTVASPPIQSNGAGGPSSVPGRTPPVV